MSYPPYEQRQRAKPTGERVEERMKRMRGGEGRGKRTRVEEVASFSMVTSIFEHNSCASEPRLNLLSE